MAHVVKIKSSGMAPMVGHYNREAERRGYERDNIDPSRTVENYAVGAPDTDALAARVRQRVVEAIESHEKASGKALRKDANVLADWVVTCPQDCPEGLRGRFFEAVVSFIRERYGKENVPGGFVHMDEKTPHVHVPVVPERDGKLVASKVINRADLKSFHGDLGKAVDEALGLHVSIELDEERLGEKQLSHLDQKEYRAAKDRLECLRQREGQLRSEIEELQPAAVTLSESVSHIVQTRRDGSRLQVAEAEKAELGKAVGELERQVADAGRRIGELERGMPVLRGRYRELEQRFRAVERRVTEVVSRLREVPETVSGWALDIASKLGKRTYDPRSLAYMARQATEAARGMNSSREQAVRQNRGQTR